MKEGAPRIIEYEPRRVQQQRIWARGETFIPDSLTSVFNRDVPRPIHAEGLGEGFRYPLSNKYVDIFLMNGEMHLLETQYAIRPDLQRPDEPPPPLRFMPGTTVPTDSRIVQHTMSHTLVGEIHRFGKMIAVIPLVGDGGMLADSHGIKHLVEGEDLGHMILRAGLTYSAHEYELEPLRKIHEENEGGEEAISVERTANGVHVEALFEQHDLYTREQRDIVKERLKEKLTAVFSKEARNIFYQELVSQDPQKQEVFDKAFARYGSFKKAWFHLLDYLASGKALTAIELDAFIRSFEISSTPTIYYATTVHEVLDELKQEGFAIQVALERGDYEHRPEFDSTQENRTRDMDEMKIDILWQTQKDRAREVAIARHISEIASAPSEKEETNIFLLMGPAHVDVIPLLLSELQRATSAERILEYRRGGKLDEFDRKYIAIYIKVKNGEEVTDAEWQELFSE